MIDRAVLFASMLALAVPAAPAHSAARDATAHPFDQMKQLVGTWRNADNPVSPLSIQFSLTAGGTVLVETWKRGAQDHSLTLYHTDGAAIVATHYCPQGNQPRLASTPAFPDKVIRFAFRDATGLDAGEAYLTELAFDLTDKAMLVRRETYRQAGVDEKSELKLVRDR